MNLSIAVEYYKDEQLVEGDGFLNVWLPKIIEKTVMKYSKHYKIREFEELSHPEQINKKWIVNFKANTFNYVIDEEKSLRDCSLNATLFEQ